MRRFSETRHHQSSKRKAESLRCGWAISQSAVQNYLAAEKLYHSKPVSGEAAEDASRNVKRFYCRQNKKKGSSGVSRDGSPFRSLEAVAILRNRPEFSGTNIRKELMQRSESNLNSKQNNNQEVKNNTDVISETNVRALAKKNVGKFRPMGS